MFEKHIIDHILLTTSLCSIAVAAFFGLSYIKIVTLSTFTGVAQNSSLFSDKPQSAESGMTSLATVRRGKRTPIAPLAPIVVATSTTQVTSPVVVAPAPLVTPPTTHETELMAWIYPGAPACLASTEISDGRHIDVLKAEYFTVRDTGTLTLLHEAVAGCNGYSEKNIALLKQFSTSQYVTVSSASAGAMELFLKGDTHTAVNTLVSFITTNQLTGVELDYEDFGSWTGGQYSLYKEFVTLLGNELHAQGKKLIIDGPAVASASEEGWFVWRYEDFTSLPVDQIVVMAYDHQYDEGVGSAISPFSWMENVIAWTENKYPDKNKIVVGLPSYGYRGIEGTTKITIETHDQIAKESGFSTATRDPLSGEMTWQSGTTRYFFQDSESLREKRAVVEKMGLSSLSVWHLGGNLWF